MWVTFDEADGDLIICGDDRFFVSRDAVGHRLLVSTRCAHRGGPLHMGQRDLSNGCIRCPWHKMNTPFEALKRRSLPALRIGSKWTACLPVEDPSAQVIVMPMRPRPGVPAR